MYLNPDDAIVSRVIARDGIWEPLETKVFRSHVGPGDVVVDVGANLGYYTLLAARLVGAEGHVYAFEPDPESFALLERNVELNGYENVTAVPLALGKAPGKLPLYLNAKNRGDHRVYDPTGERRSVEVDVVTLDAYREDHGVERVDFLKIDTQGAECLILAGAEKTLAQAGLTIVLEFTPHFLAAMDQDPRTCFQPLVSPRFRLHDIDEWKAELRPTDLDALLEHYSVESKKFTNVLVEPVE
jgi:FkbM family methyltransferase